MKKIQRSLTEQILALSNPTPDEGAEDFWDEDTTAKVVDFDEAEEDVAKPSSLRKKTAHQSLDEDSRYKGLRTSRKAWSSLGQEEDDDHDEEDFMDDDEEEDEVEEEEEEEEEDDELIAEKLQEMTRKLKGKKIVGESLEGEDSSVDDSDDDFDDGEDDDEEKDSDEEEEQNEEEEDEEDEDDEEEEDEGIEGFSQVNASEDVEKGKAVQSQLGLWDSFMETRIKLQKALHLSNQLPQCQTLERFLEDEDDSELQAVVKQSEKELVRLMQSLISVQDTLLEQNPETRHIIHGEAPGNQPMNSGEEDDDDDDEEIPSDTDDEVEADKPTTPTPQVKHTAQKRKVDPSDFGEHLAKHHKSFESFRNNTIQRWYEKTKLSTGKLSKKSFSGFERSALVQIQQILQDQNRLVQRTQLKRSEYSVLGQRSQEERKGEDGEDEPMQDIPETANQHLKNYDPEIFDDNDFYHQLLRELIERRTSSTTDPIQLTRQWLQVQKLRTKVKRQVDTKASKGRKLRYDVHQKLVSFMAPEDTSPMLPEARLELFKSLFGQSITEEETAR